MTITQDPGHSPVTERGRRTRAGLIAAARRVFERNGFAATRMGDITQEAGVSHGTVYTYFDTKEAVLTAAVQELVADIRESIRSSEAADPVERILLANMRYVTAYTTHAKLMRVVEEVSTSDDSFAAILTDLRRTHAKRVSGHIAKLQEGGVVPKSVDPTPAAAALCAMVEGYARNWSAEVAADLDGAAANLTYLWANAVGLKIESGVAGRPPVSVAVESSDHAADDKRTDEVLGADKGSGRIDGGKK